MDGFGQVLDIASDLQGQGPFGNQIGGMGSDNMNPQYLAAAGLRHDLGLAGDFPNYLEKVGDVVDSVNLLDLIKGS